MKRTVTETDFLKAFREFGRDEAWTKAGLQALYEYLTEIERNTGEEIELDPIALDCEYAEYGTAIEAARDCGLEVNDEEDALEQLREATTIIEFDDGLIIQQI